MQKIIKEKVMSEPEPDQIDMMSESELRIELRKLIEGSIPREQIKQLSQICAQRATENHRPPFEQEAYDLVSAELPHLIN